MDDYASYIFNGKCPYTDEPCLEKISCIKCQTNEREKALMEKMDEMEMLETLQAEIKMLVGK
jgi:hypothetical protein